MPKIYGTLPVTPTTPHSAVPGIGEARRETPSEPSTPPKTLRDDFAMAIIQGMIASPRVFRVGGAGSPEADSMKVIVDIAYLGADLMLERRLA